MSGENPKKIIKNHVDRVRVASSWGRPPAVINLLELLDFQTPSHLLDLQTLMVPLVDEVAFISNFKMA